MYSIMLPALIANLTATGCALLLLRRGPTRRLRLLTLAVGLMSLCQTASLVHVRDMSHVLTSSTSGTYHSLAGCLSLLAIYLLGREIYDRSIVDHKLRLTEHELPITTPGPRNAPSISTELQRTKGTISSLPQELEPRTPARREHLHQAAVTATGDLLALLARSAAGPAPDMSATPTATHSASPGPGVPSSGQCACGTCRETVKQLASGWLEVHLCMELESSPFTGERLQTAKNRLAQILRDRQQHEFRTGHQILQPTLVLLPHGVSAAAVSCK